MEAHPHSLIQIEAAICAVVVHAADLLLLLAGLPILPALLLSAVALRSLGPVVNVFLLSFGIPLIPTGNIQRLAQPAAIAILLCGSATQSVISAEILIRIVLERMLK